MVLWRVNLRARVEKRKARRIPNPITGRWPRPACDHLRGVLYLDGGERVVLATEPLPLKGDEGVARFVRRSVLKLRPHVADDALFEHLLSMLTAQASKYRETPEQEAHRLERAQRVRKTLKIALRCDKLLDDAGQDSET
jgi:hypothetical protein